MKKSLLYIATALLGATAFSSCDDNFEQPPLSVPTATIQANTTIADLKAKFYATDNNYATLVGTKDDGSNYIIHGTVTTSDEAGNFFKQIVIADETSAIQLDVDAYDLYESYQVGQDVVIDVTGLYVGAYGKLMQIGAAPSGSYLYPGRVDETTFGTHAQVNGLSHPENVVATTVTIDELNTIKNNTTDWLNWQCKLVKIENVTFEDAGHQPLATSGSSVSRNITDENGNTIIVYTSGYSDFYEYICPTGTGSITAVLSCYNNNWQLRLNDMSGLEGFDEFTKEATPIVLDGDGTEEKPYTVTDIKNGATGTEAWVKGYIVGWVDGQVLSTGANFNSSATSQTNVLIAASADVTSVADCIPIQLPSGDIRTAVNLQSNPGNLGKLLEIKGSIESYFGTTGVKSATTCKIDGVAPSTGGSSDSSSTGETIYSETFTAGIGKFQIVDVTTNDNVSAIWAQSSSYGMKATGFASSTNYATESWLVSPEINLTGASNVTVSFDQALNYFTDMATAKDEAALMIRESGKEWSQITGYTYPESLGWTFTNSGAIDLSSYVGKTVQFAFRYKSTATKAGTWEVKTFTVSGTGGSVGSNPGK
jgi:hypothetical protein